MVSPLFLVSSLIGAFLRTIIQEAKLKAAGRRLSQKFNHAHLGILKNHLYYVSKMQRSSNEYLPLNINIKNDHQNNDEICFCVMLTSCCPLYSRLINLKMITGLYSYSSSAY